MKTASSQKPKISISWKNVTGPAKTTNAAAEKGPISGMPQSINRSAQSSTEKSVKAAIVPQTVPTFVEQPPKPTPVIQERQSAVEKATMTPVTTVVMPVSSDSDSDESHDVFRKATISKPKITFVPKFKPFQRQNKASLKPLSSDPTDISSAIADLTKKGKLDTIKGLKTYPKVDKIAQTMFSDEMRFVIGGPTGSGKTVGTAALISNIMAEYDPATAHTVYISIPLRVGVTSCHKYLKESILSTKAANKVGYAEGGTINYNKNQPVRIATTNHVFNRLAKMLNDPNERDNLNGMLVIVDEAHTPTMENYLLISLCLYIQEQGYSLRIGVMSATLDSAPLLDEFEGYTKIELEGHMFNTNIVYSEKTPEEDKELIPMIIENIRDYAQQGLNILVFVSGEKVINDIMKKLKNDGNLDVCALFSRMPREEMDLAFMPAPKGKVKVIISTNMTESSVTLPNMDVVIDTGKEIVAEASKTGRAMKYVERWISQASAKQRAGRVGRTKKGINKRLWTETHEMVCMKKHSESDFFRINPEIQVLKLISLNLDSKAITRLDNRRHAMIMKRLLDIDLIKMDGADYAITDIGLQALEFQVTLDIAVALAHLSHEKDMTTKIIGMFVLSLIEGCGGYLPFWASADVRGDIAKHGYDVAGFDSFKGEDDIDTFFQILFGEDGLFTTIRGKNVDTSDKKKLSAAYRDWAKNALMDKKTGGSIGDNRQTSSINNKQINDSIRLLRQLAATMFSNNKSICVEMELLKSVDKRVFDQMAFDYRESLLNSVRRCLIKAFPGENYTPCQMKYGSGYTDGVYKYAIDKRRSYCTIMDKSLWDMPAAYPLSISVSNTGKTFVSGIIKNPDGSKKSSSYMSYNDDGW
jgi:superfamily II DNA or RNA helicase